jgi:hypothetical protein
VDYLLLQIQVMEWCGQISDLFVRMNMHRVWLKFQSVKPVTVTCLWLLFAVKHAAGVSAGVAARIASQILEPGQPRCFSPLSTRQVSLNLLLYRVVLVQ